MAPEGLIRPCMRGTNQRTGPSIPRGNDAFPSVSDSPYFRKICQPPWTIFPLHLFQNKFFDFHPPNFLMTLLVIDSTFLISSPVFAVSAHFSPAFANFPL